MLRGIATAFIILAAALLTGSATAQKDRQPPYWASISAGNALMRTGPAQTYPATWRYVRADLPIRVVRVHENWREIQDPDGTTGWMLVNLLSSTRTALVRGEGPQNMHQERDEASAIAYRAMPGVVGRIEDCDGNWCRFDVGGRRGFIPMHSLWGVDPGEET